MIFSPLKNSINLTPFVGIYVTAVDES